MEFQKQFSQSGNVDNLKIIREDFQEKAVFLMQINQFQIKEICSSIWDGE
jgi:hypothetical protein